MEQYPYSITAGSVPFYCSTHMMPGVAKIQLKCDHQLLNSIHANNIGLFHCIHMIELEHTWMSEERKGQATLYSHPVPFGRQTACQVL